MIVKHLRSVLAVLLVTLTCVGTAHAYVFQFSPMPGENIEFVSEGPLTLEASGISIRCQVTLSGTFSEATFPKTVGTQFGSLNGSSTESCSGGSLSFLRLRESPLSVTYQSFTGTLPNVTALGYRIVEVRLQATSVLTCTYAGNVDSLMPMVEEETWEVGASVLSTRLTLSSGLGCPESATLSGRLELPNMQVILESIMRFNPPGIEFENLRRGQRLTRPVRFENATPEQIEITEVRTRGECASFSFSNGMGRLRAGENLIGGGTGRIDIEATFEPTTINRRMICSDIVKARLRGIERRRVLTVIGRGIA